MSDQLADIGIVLAHVERLATALRIDPDGHVRRSANELRVVFDTRGPMEPAVARVRDSVQMLRSENHGGSVGEFRLRGGDVDRLEQLMEEELLPSLRRVGFEV